MIPNNLLTSSEYVLDLVFSSLKNQRSLLLTYFNQNCFNIYQEAPVYRSLIDNEFSVYADGIGIFFCNKLRKIKGSRIDATELNGRILKKLNENQISIGIVGGNFSERTIEEQCSKNRLNLSGYLPGFFPDDKLPEIIERARNFNSSVFLIGMGVPRQEFFSVQLSRNVEGKVIICVGNFLEYFFAAGKRAPAVFRKLGFEWAYRLIREPKRLWRRYLIGIPKFIIINIKELFFH